MAERTNIPGANVPSSAACGQWETLLADALDGVLTPQDEATFAAHKATCQACAALYEEARRGREWLEFLAPEPEVPAGLVDRILAQTGPGHKAAQPVLSGAGVMALPLPAWQRPGFMGSVRRWAEPRLMMTAAMAFFSIALTLNLTGVRLTQIRLSELRPAAVRSYMERQLNMASVPIIRYYDHLRLVYEVQSGMRELRGDNNETPGQNNKQPAGQGESRKKDGGSRVETPQRQGQPVQANAASFGDYVETSLDTGNKGTGEQGNTRRTPRAFRRLQNPRRASERSRVWTA
jgi:Putative zinc-finger